MDPCACNSKDDVLKFLVSRLAWIHEECPVRKGWRQELGYRHFYYIQQVWHNPATGQYAFHSDDDNGWDPDTPPNMGMYDTFSDLLSGVADRYHQLWTRRQERTVTQDQSHM